MNRGADEARRRLKQRSGAMISFVVGPIILAVAAVKVFEPHEYTVGDIRNSPIFWICLAVVVVVFVSALMIGSFRVLRRHDT